MCLVLGASLIWHPACPTAQGTDSYLHTLIILASTCTDSKVLCTCAQLFFYLLLSLIILACTGNILHWLAITGGESWCKKSHYAQQLPSKAFNLSDRVQNTEYRCHLIILGIPKLNVLRQWCLIHSTCAFQNIQFAENTDATSSLLVHKFYIWWPWQICRCTRLHTCIL